MKNCFTIKRYSLIVLFAILGICQVYGNTGDETYYAKAKAEIGKGTGEGKVYASANQTNNPDYGEGNTTNVSSANSNSGSATITFYMYAQAEEGSEFTGWSTTADKSNQIENSNTLPYQYKVNSNVNNENDVPASTLYAIFEKIPLFYFSATATAVPNDAGTASVNPATMKVSAEHWNSPSASTNQIAFEATDGPNHTFTGWSATENGPIVSTDNPYYPNLTSTSKDSDKPTNTTYYARFIPYPTGITATPTSLTLVVGESSAPITATVSPTGAYSNITFESSDPSVASVDANGVVTAGSSAGSTTITVKALKSDGTTVAVTTTVSVSVIGICETPVINIDNTTGNTTITCSTEGATIYYTTDGSDPTTSSTVYNGPFTVTKGTVVKAMATKSGSINSAIASQKNEIAGPTGVSGNVVTLNDFEDHKWSYYSDAECPIHSLNPADVKITYNGNGTKTVTNADESSESPTSFSLDATTVKVGPNDNANVFVYYKTLERENVDGTGNVPYTTIPNPFLVRPTGNSSTVTITPTYGTVYLSWSCNNWTYNRVQAEVTYTYTDPDGKQQSDSKTSNGYTIIQVKAGTKVTLTSKGSRAPSGGNSRSEYQPTITARLNNNAGDQIGTVTSTTTTAISSVTSEVTASPQTITTSTYRGFYAWRVKSKSEGLSITDVNGNSFANNIIPAETEIRFVTSNEYGNEVEFEALWAQAYVTDETSNLSTRSNSYERNFHVVKSSTSAASFQKSYPLTVTSYYPDGTSAGGSVTGGFTAAADTKFENITISNATNSTWTANGHDLIVGRGCSGTVNYLRGISQNISNPNYTIRLESGSYNYLSYLMGYYTSSSNNTGGGNTVSGTLVIKSLLGCDYDRASKVNDKLTILYNAIMGNSTSVNSEQETLNITVKSGNIGSNVPETSTNIADAYQSIYLSVAGTQRKVGKRSLTVEGGILANIAGGIDEENNSTHQQTDFESLYIRVKGGVVRGSIYGGAAKSPAGGNRRMIFTGGTVFGWVGAGCNGTSDDGGQTYGNSKMYIGGDCYIGQTGTEWSINGVNGGYVFGAGKGFAGGDGTSGEMSHGTTLVVADNAYIKHDVYGGGNYGYTTDSYVYILGGTIGGGVFGGSNQKGGENTFVTMIGGQVNGGVYGGSNDRGTISGNVTMQINGGQVGTSSQTANIHGGGYGQDTRVSGKVEVTLGTTGQTTEGVVVWGDVYGGSALGTVNSDANYHTYVTMHKGTINGSLYGGGLGSTSVAANVNGPVKVEVHGGSVKATSAAGSGGVYGANNIKGAPQRSVTVDIYGTDPAPAEGQYALHAVYGGGNQADYTYGNGYPTVTVHNCDNSIEYVYGGGNAAAVAATDVTIYGGNVIGNVFGGGNGESGTAANVNGDVDLKIYGGTILNVFGGSNSLGNINGSVKVNVNSQGEGEKTPCPMIIGNVYGGGNEADGNAGTLTIGCTGALVEGDEGHLAHPENIGKTLEGIGAVYGGANNANIGNDVTLNINSGMVANVFGGNNTGGNINGDITVNVNKNAETCGWYVGNVYGAGNLAAYTGSPAVNIQNGTVSGNVFGGGLGETAIVTGNPQVTIGDLVAGHEAYVASVGGDVYGGGDAANVVGTPKVNIVNKCNTTIGNVYGGGNAADVNGTDVNIDGGTITGMVFGGGHGDNSAEPQISANVNGNVNLDITGGTINKVFGGSNSMGNITGSIALNIQKVDGHCDMRIAEVYGGGNEADGNAGSLTIGCTGALVEGDEGHLAHPENIGKTLEGIGAVYGGANNANIGNDVTLNINSGMVANVFGGNNTGGTVNGDVTVNVNKNVNTCGWYVGKVHGGGYGKETNVAKDVTVNIENGTIYGDVYGGSALGKVNTDTDNTTTVNLTGGLIKGDAYGGGLGDSTTEADVNGNVTVTLNGTAFELTTIKDDKGNTIPTSGRIFGCNNINGSPKGTVLVKVLNTVAKDSDGTAKAKPAKGSGIYELQAVYGGGNLAAYNPTNPLADGQFTSYTYGGNATPHDNKAKPVQVVIDGCDKTSIEYVYGGGNAAATPATDVTILGSYEIGNVFGGGNGKDRYTLNGGNTWNKNEGADVGIIDATAYATNKTQGKYGTGNAMTSVLGGTVNYIYGGSNTKGNVVGNATAYLDKASDCPLVVNGIYGGGNEAYMDGKPNIVLGCIDYLKEIYGGSRYADVGSDINITITSGHFDRVFGGNNLGGAINGSITVNIEETGCNPITIGEVYGGGNKAAYSVYGYEANGKPKETGEKLYSDPVVNIRSFTSIGRVFGGGLGEEAVMAGSPTVNINEVKGVNADNTEWTYLGKTIEYADGTSVTLPTHSAGAIGAIGTVFGGGNAAKVIGNTHVNIGTQESVIFRTPETNNDGTPTTEIERTHKVEGADIRENVYGGGNKADVTGKTNVTIGQQPVVTP